MINIKLDNENIEIINNISLISYIIIIKKSYKFIIL